MDTKSTFLLRTDKSLLITEETEEEHEYRQTQYPDDKKVLKEKVKCTACDANLKEETFSKLQVYVHPALKVIICEDCEEFYGGGDFSADEDGSDKYCRWCGQGGNLYCCSQCSVAICSKCVKRNFARSYLSKIEEDDWKCFICDTKPIWPHRALCDAVRRYINANSKKIKSSKRTKAVASDSEIENADTSTRKSKRKKKNSSSEEDNVKAVEDNVKAVEDNVKAETVEKSKRGRCSVTKEKSSSSGERSGSTDGSVNVTPDKQRGKLLERLLKDTINDYETLTDLMIKSRINYVNKYLKSKRFVRDPSNTSVLEKKLNELLGNSKESIERLERNFNSSLRNIQSISDDGIEKLSSIDEKKQDIVNSDGASEPMDVTETAPNVADAESIVNGVADKETVVELDETSTSFVSSASTLDVEKSKSKDTIANKDEGKTGDNEDAESEITGEKENTSVESEAVNENADAKVVGEETVNEKAEIDGAEEAKLEGKDGVKLESNKEAKLESEEEAKLEGKEGVKLESNKETKLGSEEEAKLEGKEKASKKEISGDEKTIDDDDENREKDHFSTTNGLEENSCNTSTAEDASSVKSSSVVSDIEKESNGLKNTPSSSQKKKDQIAKAAILQFSSCSEHSSSENEAGLKSSGSGMSGIDSLKSDKERVKLRTKRKRKEKTAVEEEKSNIETKVTDVDNDEKEINRLTNLSNLKSQRKLRSDSSSDEAKASDESEKEKKKQTRKLSLKKKNNNKKSLEEYLSNGSDADNVVELSDNDSFSKYNSLIDERKKNYDLNKNQMSKQFLLDSSDSNNSSSDDETFFESASEKNSPKKSFNSFNGKLEGKIVDSSDSNANSDFENEDKENIKKSRPSWKNDGLLRGRISETDTSDEERIIQNARIRKEKYQQKSKTVNDSSDSEDLFRPNRSTPITKKRRNRLSSASSDQSYRQKSNSSSVEIISDDEIKKKKQKRRKRIKVLDDSEYSDDEAKESRVSGQSASKGRKNIRKVMEDTDLTEQTRRTAKEEELRKQRISERQALFNESFKIPESVEGPLTKLVLDFDPQTKEELISVHPDLIKKLKPHQAQGVKFMWDSCFESIKQIKKNTVGGGCILAHCMGLGKTLQVITLVHTVLRYEETNVKTVLVICPLSTVLNWVHEFEFWLRDVNDDSEIDVYHLSRGKSNILRADCLRHWHEEGGVMIVGYEMFRGMVNTTKVRKKIKERMNEALLDPGPDLVICDEGHVLKNESSAVSIATMKIRTLRRIVLTGTPLQNNLKEYHCMVQFVKPNLLGDRKEFLNRFANPITNGQYIDSTKEDVRIMKRRAHVLHKMLDGIVQRFDYSVLTPFLPPKHEFVISVALSDLQAKLYEHYINTYSRVASGSESSLFRDYQIMRLIWTHPYAMKIQSMRAKKIAVSKAESDSESLKDFIVSGSDEENSGHSSTSSSKSVISVSSDGGKKGKQKKGRLTRSRRKELGIVLEEEKDDNEPEADNQWWHEFITEDNIEDCKQGPKLILLFAILRECENIGDKVLIFSQSIPSLDMIEHFLQRTDEFSQRISMENSLAGEDSVTGPDYLGTWQKNVDYFRLDGQTPNDLRSQYCNAFNKSTNYRSRLFLISTKAGGLGINLTSANRVIIFDASWNPSHDVQSIFRVYRFGQNKPCYIYRFLAQGTMEEKIYERQVTKLSISCRVVDEQQIDRHFSHNEIEELYTFNRKSPSEDETPKLPKDRLMAELLKEYKDIILSYHEHDSLLENVIDEELTEEERKHAWDEYENEKNRVIPPPNQLNWANPTPGMMNMHVSDEAILTALRKEHPNQSDENLKPMVNMVREKLQSHYEQNLRHSQMMKAAQQARLMTPMNNPQMMYANQKELNEQAQIRKAAFMHQLANKGPALNTPQPPPSAGFESHWQSGYSTPKKSNDLPPFNRFSTYASPVKNLFPKFPNVTPTKNVGSPSPNKKDVDGGYDGVDADPLKTPATWAFKWNNPNQDNTLLERILKTNCQWRAKYEKIGDSVVMHLPFCVRADTLKNKLSDYLDKLQFYRVIPEMVDPLEAVEVLAKCIRLDSGVN